MRTSEWTIILFFVLLTGLACLRQLTRIQRLQAVAIGIVGVCLALAPHLLQGYLNVLFISVLHDWLPAPLMLMVYWQTGRFFKRPNERLQHSLGEIDNRFLGEMLPWLCNPGWPSWLAGYLEFSYLFCYPLVPLGVGVLYITGRRTAVDYYWTIVLVPTCLCYALTTFIQMLPPRALAAPLNPIPNTGKIRALNLWILRHASIQVNTFPSAHVAATIGAALALLGLVPWAGVVFLFISLSIAAGSVTGRYHYLADALIAALLATVTFLLV